MTEGAHPADDIEDGERYYHDGDLWHILSTMAVEGYSVEENEDERLDVTVHVGLDDVHLARLLDERAEYIRAARGEDPTVEDVVDSIVADLKRGLDAEYNTVGHDELEEGLYERINDSQWKSIPEEAVYDEYSDLLWEVTGDDGGEHGLTIPSLREPFLRACVESDDHELPRPGAVSEIVSQHIRNVKSQQESRAAVSALKQRLESRGINPRTAASVASDMDDLLVTDAELGDGGE